MTSPFAKDLEARIEAFYRKTENTLGWRFLYSPSDVLEGARVAFIGLNPGGRSSDKDHARFSTDGDSAYGSERWAGHGPGQSPLQKQVLRLFEYLGEVPSKVLAGNLVPVRSPSWKDLKQRRECLDFSEEIWSEVLRRGKPNLIVAMGMETGNRLSSILEAEAFERVAYGWGKNTLKWTKAGTKRLVVLPHLSRFRIVGREKSMGALRSAFGVYWRE